MEHRTLDEIKRVARLTSFGPAPRKMSRRERLERWASIIERHEGAPLRPLMRIEFLPEHERVLLRGQDTPLAIAFKDPVLRDEGLASDRLGDAMEFFSLREGEAHYLLCDCHYYGAMTPDKVAARMRSLASCVGFRDLWEMARGAARQTAVGWL